MSYSFSVKAATAAEAGAKVHEELGKVAIAQPQHTELDDVHDIAQKLLNALREPKDGEQVYASVSGSCWAMTAPPTPGFESVGANVSVGFTTA